MEALLKKAFGLNAYGRKEKQGADGLEAQHPVKGVRKKPRLAGEHRKGWNRQLPMGCF